MAEAVLEAAEAVATRDAAEEEMAEAMADAMAEAAAKKAVAGCGVVRRTSRLSALVLQPDTRRVIVERCPTANAEWMRTSDCQA